MTPSTTSSDALEASAEASADSPDFGSLYEALGYHFTDSGLLTHALTHRSWCAEHVDDPSNERLEFLGDSILGVTITERLFHEAPDMSEGGMAKARAEVVSAPSLAVAARRLGIGGHLRLGRGEESSGGREKESILADAMEAVIAAVYLDAGREVASLMVNEILDDAFVQALSAPGERDFKTRLQERASVLGLDVPSYEMSFTGPDHGRRFNATVTVGSTVGRGSGTSKKQAEQNAAAEAFKALEPGGQE